MTPPLLQLVLNTPPGYTFSSQIQTLLLVSYNSQLRNLFCSVEFRISKVKKGP